MKINVEANYIKYLLFAAMLLLTAWIILDWKYIVKGIDDARNNREYNPEIENTY